MITGQEGVKRLADFLLLSESKMGAKIGLKACGWSEIPRPKSVHVSKRNFVLWYWFYEHATIGSKNRKGNERVLYRTDVVAGYAELSVFIRGNRIYSQEEKGLYKMKLSLIKYNIPVSSMFCSLRIMEDRFYN